MEADCRFSERVGAFDTWIQKPAFRRRPHFLPKTPFGKKDRVRLGRRSEGMDEEKADEGYAVRWWKNRPPKQQAIKKRLKLRESFLPKLSVKTLKRPKTIFPL
jgi:hypothetical protein